MTEPGAPTTSSDVSSPAAGARRRRVGRAAAVVLGIVAIYVAASMAVPATVPRLRVLPKPPDEPVWSDGCNDHGVWWEPSGPIWARGEWSTVVGCGSHGIFDG